MSADIGQKLDQINQKLQAAKENAFLSRLDMMFSVLASLTFFGTGLLFAQYNNIRSPLFSPLLAFFPMLAFTLVGEAYSILKDDITYRFAFWLVFISSLGFLGAMTLASVIVFLFNGSYSVLILVALIVAYGLVKMLNWYVRLFWRVVKQLPSRFTNPQDSYGTETPKLLKPMIAGVIFYMAFFVPAILILALNT